MISDPQKGDLLGSSTLWTRAALLVSFAVLLLWSYRNLASGRLEGRIVDDKTGLPLAATVLITDQQGKNVEIEGKHAHVEYLAKRRCYVDGAFSLNAPSDGLEIEVRRGLETFPVKAKID